MVPACIQNRQCSHVWGVLLFYHVIGWTCTANITYAGCYTECSDISVVLLCKILLTKLKSRPQSLADFALLDRHFHKSWFWIVSKRDQRIKSMFTSLVSGVQKVRNAVINCVIHFMQKCCYSIIRSLYSLSTFSAARCLVICNWTVRSRKVS